MYEPAVVGFFPLIYRELIFFSQGLFYCGKIHIKFTILILLKYIFAHCCATNYPLQNIFIIPNWNPALIKSITSHPPTPTHQPLVTTVLLSHMSGILQYLSFCDWLISLRIKSLRFIYVVACVKISTFLRLNTIPL